MPCSPEKTRQAAVYPKTPAVNRVNQKRTPSVRFTTPIFGTERATPSADSSTNPSGSVPASAVAPPVAKDFRTAAVAWQDQQNSESEKTPMGKHNKVRQMTNPFCQTGSALFAKPYTAETFQLIENTIFKNQVQASQREQAARSRMQAYVAEQQHHESLRRIREMGARMLSSG